MDNILMAHGMLVHENIIRLPEEWEELIDEFTITVSITPIGAHQDIIVKRYSSSEILLQANAGIPIRCFYQVFGEKKYVTEEEVDENT